MTISMLPITGVPLPLISYSGSFALMIMFALGIVLYELLTGTTPLDGEKLRSAAYEEMKRLIREETPAKPSTRVSATKSKSANPSNPSNPPELAIQANPGTSELSVLPICHSWTKGL